MKPKHEIASSPEECPDTESMPQDVPSTNADAFASLSRFRKNLLYTVITLALAIDVLNVWGIFVALERIAHDVGLEQGGNAIWNVSVYAIAFAACIPLGGRLCDVLPVQWWFVAGFAGMGCLDLGSSFGESPGMARMDVR
jgi:MFS family permease